MTIDDVLRTALAVTNAFSGGLVFLAAWDANRHDRPGNTLLFVASMPPLLSAAIFGGLL